jgi:hypothetical protein
LPRRPRAVCYRPCNPTALTYRVAELAFD